MKMKKSVLLFLGSAACLGSIVFATATSTFIELKGEECKHQTIEEYKALAPTLSKGGLMHHFACCDCHNAWRDADLDHDIGNTVTDRSKIEIRNKTNSNKIDKTTISVSDEILLANSNHVYGLDQTMWGSSLQGVGSGYINYYSIDGRNALRISTEEISDSQVDSLDYSNYGYSEIGFNKYLTGTIFASFDYKIYDLNTEQLNNQARVQAVWLGKNGYKYVTEMELDVDNEWHTINVASLEKIEVTGFAIKIYHFDGEMYINNLSLTSSALDFPQLYREGLEVKWSVIENADYYIVHDSNNNPNEIQIDASAAVENVFSYRPEAAGKHDIYVTAHSNNTQYDPASSNIIAGLEVDPVFFYDNMINEYFVDTKFGEKEYSWSQVKKVYKYEGVEEDINGVENWGLVDGKYHAYYTDAGTFSQNAEDRLRFDSTETGGNLARIVQEAKELGTNVLHVSNRDGFLPGATTLENFPALKTIMDYAHANNLKVTLMANEIYSASAGSGSYTNEQAIRSGVKNYLKAYCTTLLEHPAFYGFALRDEPPRVSYGDLQPIDCVAWTASAILDYYKENYGKINFSCDRPFFNCALLQLGGTNFDCEWNYMNYVEEWIYITGLDYYATDIYTYTTQQKYGDNPEGIDINYRIYFDLKKKYKNLKLHLTTTSNNDIYERDDCNQYDIFGSTLYAAALNNYGISRYTYYPAMDTYWWRNGVVDRDGSHTSKYDWIKEAQTQFEFIQNKLHDYDPVSMSYQTSGEYGATSANTRRMDITLSDGLNEALMIVNYNSQASYNSSFSVSIASGKAYYLFGQGQASTEYISAGGSVTLNNGTAVLIMETNPYKIADEINSLISTANEVDVSTDQGKAHFLTLSASIDEKYNKISNDMKNRIYNYSDYQAKKESVSDRAEVVFSGNYRSDYVSMTRTSDPRYGSMNVVEWSEGKTGTCNLRLDSDLIGENWSEYTKIGLFARFSTAITDAFIFIPNNVWGNNELGVTNEIRATRTTVDSTTNLFYYEFDLSNVYKPFYEQTYFEIYFGNGISLTKLEISDLIAFKDAEIDLTIYNELVAESNSIGVSSNREKAQLTLFNRTVDEALSALEQADREKVTGYSTYISRKNQIASTTGVLYDKGYIASDTSTAFTQNSDSKFGSMHKITWENPGKSDGIAAFTRDPNNLVGTDWSSYSSIGIFIRFSSTPTDKMFFIPNDWHQDWIPSTPVTVDASTNLYYYEYNLSTVTGPFTYNTYFQIYFNPGSGTDVYMTSLELSDIVYFN